MANLIVKDGTNATKYVAQSGAGTDVDPFVRIVAGPVTNAELRAADVPVTLDGEAVAIASIAAGDNNIGNVDIASFPAVALITISGTCAAAGANTVVAAPAAGNHHVVHAYQLQMEEAAATLQRALLKSGSNVYGRMVGTTIGAGVVQEFPAGDKLPWDSGQAIVVDLAEAKAVGYVIRYRTVPD